MQNLSDKEIKGFPNNFKTNRSQEEIFESIVKSLQEDQEVSEELAR